MKIFGSHKDLIELDNESSLDVGKNVYLET